MTTLNQWPILSFIPPEISINIQKAFVFGGSGNQAVFVLGDGDVYQIGYSQYNTLSSGDGERLTPTKLEILSTKDIIRMACGIGPHILALSSLAEVFSWGHNGFAQLGHNDPNKDEPTQLQIPGYVTQIQCGSYHSVALTSD